MSNIYTTSASSNLYSWTATTTSDTTTSAYTWPSAIYVAPKPAVPACGPFPFDPGDLIVPVFTNPERRPAEGYEYIEVISDPFLHEDGDRWLFNGRPFDGDYDGEIRRYRVGPYSTLKGWEKW